MKNFIEENKLILVSMAVLAALLFIAFGLEMATEHHKDPLKPFLFQPALLLGGMYAVGLMLCALIPLGLVKNYRGHLLTPPDDDADMRLMAQISVYVITMTLILFTISSLVDYWIGKAVMTSVCLGLAHLIIKISLVILAILGIGIIIMKIFTRWVAPATTWLFGKTLVVAIIGVLCLVLLVATCNRTRTPNTVMPPAISDTPSWESQQGRSQPIIQTKPSDPIGSGIAQPD